MAHEEIRDEEVCSCRPCRFESDGDRLAFADKLPSGLKASILIHVTAEG